MKQKFKKRALAAVSAAVILSLISLTACRSQKDISSSDGYVSSVPVVSEEEPADNGIRLVISSPAQSSVSVTEPEFTFSGTSDPEEPLTVNGQAVERGADGSFTYQVSLDVGKNTFTFEHKGDTAVYTVTYRYVIIDSFSPSGAQSYPSGSTVVVSASARKGSAVKASFNGQTVDMKQAAGTEDENSEFVTYNGLFRLPSNNVNDLDLGKITYTASHDGKSETFTSGKITCKKSDIIVDYDPNATPTGGKYINVGSGYIAEIVEYNAETFDGNVTDASISSGSVDWSRPTNNYLPQGTVDYCSANYTIYETKNDVIKYVTLRAGYRVYLEREDKPYTESKPVVKQYIGTLPDHNEIGVASLENNGSHTVLTLDTMWKAPFYFDILPQSYSNPSVQDYSVGAVTYNYIDITFCYATKFTGEAAVPEDNPLFSSAKIIENKNADGTKTRDYTLRLYLKKQGAFYGWDSYYNSNGQLCFEFLNPKEVTEADNEYGTDLNGAKILIDVGHGGIDIGAPGPDSKNHNEAVQNLNLAFKIKAELEKAGAQVYMTRTDNSTSSTDTKIKLLKQLKPDYCIAVHHNSSTSSAPNGFGSYYFDAFSKKAAEYVYSATKSLCGDIYTKNHDRYEPFNLQWHYYFMARVTNCPVVLTENGYMSNNHDYENIISEESNLKKAKAITLGIVNYFNSIQ